MLRDARALMSLANKFRLKGQQPLLGKIIKAERSLKDIIQPLLPKTKIMAFIYKASIFLVGKPLITLLQTLPPPPNMISN